MIGIVNALEQPLPNVAPVDRAAQSVKNVAPYLNNDGGLNWEAIKQRGKELAANWGLAPEGEEKGLAANANGLTAKKANAEGCNTDDPNCW